MSTLIQEQVSLKRFNTFGIDVRAAMFANINTEADLQELLNNADAKNIPMLVLGGGSNILFTHDFSGLVVKISIPGIDVVENGDEVFLTAGAGVVWNDLVIFAVEKGYAGLENLSLIPGTVGASPVQNIGAYGVELKDVFSSCTAVAVEDGKKRTFYYDDCAFDYRDSVFKGRLRGKYIITSVTFKLSKSPMLNVQYGAIQSELERRNIHDPTITDISRIVAEIRQSKLPDPTTIGNAGSFFKNPIIGVETFEKLKNEHPDVVNFPVGNNQYKLAAGWLIEQCGFKGLVDGQTGTWKNQALVLVNHGAATGPEVYSFSERIIQKVEEEFGILLEREVNVL
jgi:UDP-N-acetylmuramate dehydrogenase